MTTTGSQMTDYFENIIINHVLRSASSPSGSLSLALYEDFDEEILESQNEPNSSASYTRLNLVNKMDINSGSFTLDENIEFWRATEQWGTGKISNFTLAAGSVVQSSGSHYVYGNLNNPKPVLIQSGASVVQGFLSFNIRVGNYDSIFLNNGMGFYLANRLGYHYFTDIWDYPTPGSSIYIGLYSYPGNPDANGFVTSGSFEISASTGYHRMPWGGSGSWTAPTTGSTSNTETIVFTYSADSDWGDIKGALIFRHPDAKQVLFYCPFTETKRILEGDGFVLKAGNLKIYID